ncbi:MAG: glutathione peroxidase [Candidatus Hinthialibacter antarcticus]|nr:glutathione peroxidase [Candidatus Hinthialibacter antarcticus]
MKVLSTVFACALAAVMVVAGVAVASEKEHKSVHEFTMKDINGKELKLEKFKGKVVLLVNVASKCGYTKQYKPLQELYGKYKEKGLVIVGLPANNFGGQEPGSDKEILEFCTEKFDVSFPMLSKVSVKGDDTHPLVSYLNKQENPDFKGDINWNFEKYLIGKDGKLLHRFRSKTEPLSEDMTKAIEKALKA